MLFDSFSSLQEGVSLNDERRTGWVPGTNSIKRKEWQRKLLKSERWFLGHGAELGKRFRGQEKNDSEKRRREAGGQQWVGLGKGCSGGVANSLNSQGKEIRLDAGESREWPQVFISEDNQDRISTKEDSTAVDWDCRVYYRNPGKANETLCRLDTVGVGKSHIHISKNDVNAVGRWLSRRISRKWLQGFNCPQQTGSWRRKWFFFPHGWRDLENDSVECEVVVRHQISFAM